MWLPSPHPRRSPHSPRIPLPLPPHWPLRLTFKVWGAGNQSWPVLQSRLIPPGAVALVVQIPEDFLGQAAMDGFCANTQGLHQPLAFTFSP